MKTKFIEVTNEKLNWGKFLLLRFEEPEWAVRSEIANAPLLSSCGWDAQHLWVLDMQTGEGAFFFPGGNAASDLHKHQIWVCPMYEPFLAWLYKQDLSDIEALPALVEFTREEARFDMRGYRRPGPGKNKK